MDLPATQVCYDFNDAQTQKIVQSVEKEKCVQVGSLIVNNNTYPINKGINKIGRHPECDIYFDDQSVSKFHAEIEASTHPTNVWISDLKSSNKTLLNNNALQPTRFYELKNNSVLEFGKIKAIYKECSTKSDFVVPETPVQSKQKNVEVIIPGTPDSLLNNSSFLGGDVSIITVPRQCHKKSVSLHLSTEQLPQDVVKDNKNSACTLLLVSKSKDKRTETSIQDSILKSKDDKNDPSTSCESEDIFEAATQRVDTNVNRRSSKDSYPSSDETYIDEDSIGNDMSIPPKVSNTVETSTPEKTNSKNNLEELENNENDVTSVTAYLGLKRNTETENKKANACDNDDINILETQIVCLPNSMHSKESRSIRPKNVNKFEILDTQTVDLSDCNHAVNNVKQKSKNNTTDIDSLNTQPISTHHTSIEDIDYETAPTQVIGDEEETSKKEKSKTKSTNSEKSHRINLDDTIERKLTEMFQEVNDDNVNETPMTSTQTLKNVLELSQQHGNLRSVKSSSQNSEVDSQDSDKYFSCLLSKRKRKFASSQDSSDSNITVTNYRKKNKGSVSKTFKRNKSDSASTETSSKRSAQNQEEATYSKQSVSRIDKDLLNSFKVSVHSAKVTAKCTGTSKPSDNEDEDILTLLPEVNISGTLENSSITSSTSPVKKRGRKRRSNNKKTTKKSEESDETNERRVSFKNISESSEDMDYENLKNMAEELISNKNKRTSSRGVRKVDTNKKINSASTNVSTRRSRASLNNKSTANASLKKDKGNVTEESKTMLAYVTRKSLVVNSNTLPADLDKNKTRKRSLRSSKENSNSKVNKSDNTYDSETGEESQEVESIMSNSLAAGSRNMRKRKKASGTSDNDTLNNSNISVINQTNNTSYKIPATRTKRAKVNKNNSLQSSVETVLKEDLLSDTSENSISSTYTRTSRSTRSKQINTDTEINENDNKFLNETITRSNTSKRETSVVPSSQRNTSISSLNSSFVVKESILFTGIMDDEYNKILKALGGKKVEDPFKCTVLVTDKIRRTTKFLCSLARAVPIVSISWLQESKKAGYFLDLENYMLKDPAMEAKYGFRLRKSLDKAKQQKLLEGYTILLTPNIETPPIPELKTMIMSCGGKALLRPPSKLLGKIVIISNQDDLQNAQRLLSKVSKKVTIQSTEFLLTGILKQELDFVRHKLV